MNRQDAKGVVLTGYYSNSESLPAHPEVNCVEEADSSVSRWVGEWVSESEKTVAEVLAFLLWQHLHFKVGYVFAVG